MAMKTRKVAPQPRATREELNEFLNGLQAAQAASVGDTDRLRAATLTHLAKYSLAELQALVGRAYVDSPKSASQKLGKTPTRRGDDYPDDDKSPQSPRGSPPGRRRVPRPKPKGK